MGRRRQCTVPAGGWQTDQTAGWGTMTHLAAAVVVWACWLVLARSGVGTWGLVYVSIWRMRELFDGEVETGRAYGDRVDG